MTPPDPLISDPTQLTMKFPQHAEAAQLLGRSMIENDQDVASEVAESLRWQQEN